MNWTANSPKQHPPYQTECIIRTRDGQELEAMLIHLNPKYHTRVKDCNKWKVLNVKKKMYLDDDEVVEWRYAIDI